MRLTFCWERWARYAIYIGYVALRQLILASKQDHKAGVERQIDHSYRTSDAFDFGGESVEVGVTGLLESTLGNMRSVTYKVEFMWPQVRFEFGS